LTEYEENVSKSWVVSDLREVRNFKGGFKKGLWFGLLHGGIVSITKGREPWTIKDHVKDSESYDAAA